MTESQVSFQIGRDEGRRIEGPEEVTNQISFHRRFAHPKLASESPFDFDQLPQLIYDMGPFCDEFLLGQAIVWILGLKPQASQDIVQT